MDMHSFQYPPRPIPSDGHKPSRYYFHNLDQDHIIANKGLGFQKEGMPPSQIPPMPCSPSSTNAMTGMTPMTSYEEVPTPQPAIPVYGLEILDRSKYLVK
ncbi:hypothetical protein EMPS_08788 [Entomortierella parvispora]|uniref:Uncharacterized protein n=1 Tax=Entomortierella parvispora TaxID=205924 RepID=A0A9P3HGP6_9FUNG|nr:hypothetical protein EMPS_08788 [Entomortierella parvispora]